MPDEVLLGAAETQLRERQFRVARTVIERTPCIIGENALFILCVTAGKTVEDLRVIDAVVSAGLATSVAKSESRAKQWDVYLVLLTSDHLSSEDEGLVYEVGYNTRYLRRIIRSDVSPTPEGLAEALRVFLPLPSLPTGALSDPLTDLEAALPSHGIPTELAQRAIASYRSSGEVTSE